MSFQASAARYCHIEPGLNLSLFFFRVHQLELEELESLESLELEEDLSPHYPSVEESGSIQEFKGFATQGHVV